ncbi:hypothetical protein [uncultured Sulfitobacter sp.]|uniref:hypothetical protein n=1 Tax=uncultured Sulfitobacter sp. TaxID=191468 RepID=UPI002601C2A4|nr:hypothetical protein [uncultured Sulfitobacter sp.]
MLDPKAGRARVVRDGDKLVVSIKAKRHFFLSAFIGFWLLAWAFGWVAVASTLLFGDTGSTSLFLFGWLGAWTAGGAMAIATFLWLVAGRESIEFSTRQVSITRHIPIWSKKVDCDFSQVKGLRVEEKINGPVQNQVPNWFSRKSGNIRLDYGVHSLGFGIELDQAEAAQVVRTILAVFPELGTDPSLPTA